MRRWEFQQQLVCKTLLLNLLIAILNMAGSRQLEEPQVGKFLIQGMTTAFGNYQN
jgi:hypothetical protein